jgi:hypothetical protein
MATIFSWDFLIDIYFLTISDEEERKLVGYVDFVG